MSSDDRRVREMTDATRPTDRSAARPDGPVLAIAIEPGRLAVGLVDTDGNVLVRDRVSMPTRDVWRSLERLVRRVLAAAGSPDDYVAVGVSCVGPIDLQSGTVSPPHVPSWLNFAIVEHVEALTGRPVILDSAGGAAAEAERWLGEATSTPSFMAIVADAVVDSAVVLGGIRLSGSHGNAGSIAHSNVDPGGLECWCGARGCLDPYLSTIALEAEMNRPLRRANPSIIERAGMMLGRAISSTAAMVDIDTVYVTGSVIDAFGDAVLDTCRREIKQRSRLGYVADLELIEPVEHISMLVRAASLAVGTRDTPDRVTDR
ncbi:ROK family protein [Ilumatobacter coccineus]|uniref:Putative sugar kinase n=1 Tax=Ilumatobacter coccineus (strain NBRC 103263 / KCTC 29153 / YM16-304) TaxID=1313172 RepID=A0A6C7EC88_ILUCY|nr:ROK family protein [Ilumatobacter coccineus]BAN02248.1 putative sugar kinase [Ilumatobacter coccineus YM16-304]